MDPNLYPDEKGPSSTPTETPDATSASSTETDASAPSSGAQDQQSAPSEKKEDLLSVVMDAVKPAQPKAEEDKQPEADPKGDSPEKVADPSDVPADELAKFTPKARARIEALAKDNRALRQQFESLKPTVESHQALVSFMEANSLQQEHLGVLLEFGAALRKGDLKQAYETMKPYWDLVNEGLGHTLPADVQRQVDEGVLDANAAKELVQLRHERDRLKTTTSELAERQQHTAVANRQAEIGQGVAAWEQEVRSKDPDWNLKAVAVERFAKAIVAERGLPKSPQEARTWANEAYEAVNKTFGAMRPAPKPIRPSPAGGHAPTPSVVTEPKSLFEAAQLGLQRAQGGL